ncbi:MAG: hypothetical protein GC129_03050 [Proteobacteria bacterium]|nr:hypothetical protein [Pseudomonadota bacterium]
MTDLGLGQFYRPEDIVAGRRKATQAASRLGLQQANRQVWLTLDNPLEAHNAQSCLATERHLHGKRTGQLAWFNAMASFIGGDAAPLAKLTASMSQSRPTKRTSIGKALKAA